MFLRGNDIILSFFLILYSLFLLRESKYLTFSNMQTRLIVKKACYEKYLFHNEFIEWTLIICYLYWQETKVSTCIFCAAKIRQLNNTNVAKKASSVFAIFGGCNNYLIKNLQLQLHALGKKLPIHLPSLFDKKSIKYWHKTIIFTKIITSRPLYS